MFNGNRTFHGYAHIIQYVNLSYISLVSCCALNLWSMVYMVFLIVHFL